MAQIKINQYSIPDDIINSQHYAATSVDNEHIATGVASSKLTGALPAISGASLTSLPAGNLTGTVADARISTLTSSKLSGALPAIDGSSLTGVSGGKLLQVVNTSQASDSGSTARTVIDQDITLASASNKCLVSVTFTVLRNSGSTTAYGGFYVTGGGLGATTSGMVFSGAPLYTLGVGARVGWAATKLDASPGSTTPTYGFYFAGGADFNFAHSQITVMEIG